MRVVIVGAGLSGLTLAAFLRRLNIDCVVLEQSPFAEARYVPPVTLYANALSCFKAFGMDHVFASSNTELLNQQRFFGIKNNQGGWLLKARNRNVRMRALGTEDEIPITTAPPANSESIVSRRLAEQRKLEMGKVPLRLMMPFKQLEVTLRRSIPEIKYGCRVVDLMPHDGIKGGVHAVLEDGTTEWGDVVVGADGMHSTVRHLLYPSEYVGTSCRSLGMMHVEGFTLVDPSGPASRLTPSSYWGDRKTVSVASFPDRDECRMHFSATLYTLPQDVVDLGTADDSAQVLQLLRGLLAKSFHGFHDDIPSLVGAASLAIPVEELEVPVMPRWFNKRAVLLGEAAHGSMPSFLDQDASLCVEDAAILATALLDVPLLRDTGLEYAFRQYESVRRDRVERYIRQSRRARNFTASSHVLARNAALHLVPSPLLQLSQRWLSNWSYSAQQLEVDPKIKMETAFR